MTGPIPEWVLSIVATATIFTIMFGVGIGVALADLRWIWQRPAPMLRALASPKPSWMPISTSLP